MNIFQAIDSRTPFPAATSDDTNGGGGLGGCLVRSCRLTFSEYDDVVFFGRNWSIIWDAAAAAVAVVGIFSTADF